MAGKNNLYLEVKHVDAAIRAAIRNLKSRDESVSYTLTDKAHKGLALRLRGGTVSWMVKTHTWTKVIGYAYPSTHAWALKGVVEAKEIAGHVQALKKNGEDHLIDPYLAARHTLKDHATAVTTMRPKAGTWTLRECVDAMLEERQRPSAKKPLKPRSIEEYHTTFNRPEFALVLQKAAVDVRRSDIEEIRRAVEKKYGVGSSIKVITNTRTVFDYSATYNVGLSGLEGMDPWWMMLKSPSKLVPRTRNPEIQDIAKTMLLAEDYLDKPLPGRIDNKAGVRTGTLAAFFWILLTCQRADAATKLKAYSFVPDPERPGWYIASWDAALMKGGKTHFLPVPPRLYAFLKPFIDSAKNKEKGDWAFPSEIGSGDKHVTRSATLGIIKRLAAKDALLNKERKLPEAERRPDTRIDLLDANGIRYWTQHDVRRRLVKVMDKAGMPAGASRIMAHDITKDSKIDTSNMTPEQHEIFLKQMTAEITTRAYGDVMNMKIKGDAIEIWVNAVLDEYDRLKALRSVTENEAA